MKVNTQEGANHLVGRLTKMCSDHEREDRQKCRQLDVFERYPATCADAGSFRANPDLMVKKYQRSAADKVYRESEIRTEACCEETTKYLFGKVSDLYILGNQGIYGFETTVDCSEVYSYLADRSRGVLVDLSLQNLKHSSVFLECHEARVRFEILFGYLLRFQKDETRYSPDIGTKSMARTLQPLLEAYSSIRSQARLTGEVYEQPASEGLMVGYSLAMLLNRPQQAYLQMYMMDEEVFAMQPVRLALEAFEAYHSQNPREFLEILTSLETDVLLAILLQPYALEMRWHLCRDFFRQHTGAQVHLEVLRALLVFPSFTSLLVFLRGLGVSINDGTVLLDIPAVEPPEGESPEAKDAQALLRRNLSMEAVEPKFLNKEVDHFGDPTLDMRLDYLNLLPSQIILDPQEVEKRCKEYAELMEELHEQSQASIQT